MRPSPAGLPHRPRQSERIGRLNAEGASPTGPSADSSRAEWVGAEGRVTHRPKLPGSHGG